MQVLLPKGWAPPIGYANGIAVDAGRIVFIAGQVGWDAQQQFHSAEIAPQFEQALRERARRAGGGRRRGPSTSAGSPPTAATSRRTSRHGASWARSGAD